MATVAVQSPYPAATGPRIASSTEPILSRLVELSQAEASKVEAPKTQESERDKAKMTAKTAPAEPLSREFSVEGLKIGTLSVEEPKIAEVKFEKPQHEKTATSTEDLKIKYAEERDKRLQARPEGNAQYKEFQGIFEHYLEDPYISRVQRDPLEVETDFLVLGGGYGGLCVAAQLISSGITNMRIVDKAGDFGGTWYWNRYPGAACDIESYCYMPLLEETNYIPTEKYAKAPELQEHARRIGRHYGLYEKAIFHTEARDIEWNEGTSRWRIKTDRGDTIHARFFATASGPLNMPKLPGVEGIELYKGHSFHTSRWDYAYTGGNVRGNLDNIKGKKIGIIGTGATAVQALPHLGAGAGELYVFQRTPSSISWRNNKPTDLEWAESLEPGWQSDRQENFLKAMAGDQEIEDLVDDGWTSILKFMKKEGISGDRKTMWKEHAAAFERADFGNMESIRRRCDDIVKDPKTAEGLKPWYRQFCKRPCFHDEYLDTYNRPNVMLVHTDGKGIEKITEKGIIANGKEYELDCIIYSTGFEVGTSYQRRSNFTMKGRNGVLLDEAWKDGPKTLHGFHTPDFPNMFLISTMHSGFAANFTHMYYRQGKWVAAMVKACKEKSIKVLDANVEAAERFTDLVVKDQWRSVAYQKECTPGYYNLEGQIQDDLRTKRSSPYGQGPLAFCKLMDEWIAKGDLEGLDVTIDEKAWA